MKLSLKLVFALFYDWQRTLKAGKLNEKILRLFLATGKEEIVAVIESLNIKHILIPVLPTRKLLLSVNRYQYLSMILLCLTLQSLSGCSEKF